MEKDCQLRGDAPVRASAGPWLRLALTHAVAMGLACAALGADVHWAYRRLERWPPPAVPGIRHPVDAFIESRLREAGVPAAPEATRSEWLRRVTFDLVDRAFGQRRKMLRAIYAEIYGGSGEAESALISAGIEPTIRGESLSIEKFAAIAKQLNRR